METDHRNMTRRWVLSLPYPELTTATVQGPTIENDKAVYTFKTTIGTKG